MQRLLAQGLVTYTLFWPAPICICMCICLCICTRGFVHIYKIYAYTCEYVYICIYIYILFLYNNYSAIWGPYSRGTIGIQCGVLTIAHARHNQDFMIVELHQRRTEGPVRIASWAMLESMLRIHVLWIYQKHDSSSCHVFVFQGNPSGPLEGMGPLFVRGL